jgi:hypothetical protein
LACSSKTTGLSRPAITEAEPFGQLLCDVAGYSGRQGNLVRKALDLLALTFVRPGTVTQAEWDEFDPDGALWTIPFKKLKQRKLRESIKELTGKPHYVPLSRQAVALLRELKSRPAMVVTCFPIVRVGRSRRMHWRSRSTPQVASRDTSSDAAAISLVMVLSVRYCSNTARQASLRLAFCRRRQEVIARTFGISPGQRR